MSDIRSRADLLYREGYNRALVDLRDWLHKSLGAWKSDRKRNNVQNIIWLLEGILEDVDTFAAYGDQTPIDYRVAGKRLEYYISLESAKKTAP